MKHLVYLLPLACQAANLSCSGNKGGVNHFELPCDKHTLQNL